MTQTVLKNWYGKIVCFLQSCVTRESVCKMLIAFQIIFVLAVAFLCFKNKKPYRAVITMPISQEGQKVAFDLIFEVYRDTDFDSLIGVKSEAEIYENVVDRRQYREGYIARLKCGISEMPVDYLLDFLTHKDVNIGDYHSSVGCHLFPIQESSPYHCLGLLQAEKDLGLFTKQLWDDVTSTKWKYYEDDTSTYFKHGKSLPPTILKKRLEEMPYLQAAIFLQDKLLKTSVQQSNDDLKSE